ncbi:MAG: acetoin utilization protein AcuC [Pseudotabrizicola sp.]|uniref:acetoin utilization protein AcuC n=1 Tax=Pseudotabrizicola sp. TaxID=2939647 RepID=UPI00272F9847|nr:acetoin utilization protein AcuC [Pseudotabrizicola sp.]MDP2080448.1 acetoin utilization protein AcuC [Pseudotabrizicola sp.]MDZ7573708.1 acetoin utilization protein AcuC [Pseudotabrizicola sp.]
MGLGSQADRRRDHQADRAVVALILPLFIGSEIYRGSSYGPSHPLRVPRVSTVMDMCRALGWLPSARYRTSPRAKLGALAQWHTPDYLAALQQAEREGDVADDARVRHHLGTLSNPVFGQMFSRPATGAGGVILAAELLANGTAAVHVPGGGTHHGLPDRANGFCYLNDPVLAILALRHAGLRRIAYIDIDAHHCDGVQHGFSGDPRTLLISTHEEGRWPFTGALEDDGGGNCVNLPVLRGFNDTEMRAVLDGVILPHVQAHRPDVIILQAGADSLDEDPLSRLSLSNCAYIEVLRGLLPMAPRFLLLGGGGYNPWSVGRCWSVLWATLAGVEIPDQLPDPAQDILRALHWGGGGRPPPAPHLLTTLLDPPREGPVRPEIRARIARLAQRLRA